MGRKRIVRMYLVCMLLLLTGKSAMAATGGGAEPVQDGQTDVMAGVVVDYMGKLQFAVTDRDTGSPVREASVEIYIPSLDRYVLFGVTDEDGISELDVAFGDEEGQFAETDRQAVSSGVTLYLKDRNISYRVYKAGWLPYPMDGAIQLHTRDVPQVIKVQLYQEKKNGGGGSSGGSGGTSSGSSGNVNPNGSGNVPTIPAFPIEDSNIPRGGLETADGGIPRTGVEGTMQYWIAGLFFFLIAGGILIILLKSEAGNGGRAEAGELHIKKMAGSRNAQGGPDNGNTRRCEPKNKKNN